MCNYQNDSNCCYPSTRHFKLISRFGVNENNDDTTRWFALLMSSCFCECPCRGVFDKLGNALSAGPGGFEQVSFVVLRTSFLDTLWMCAPSSAAPSWCSGSGDRQTAPWRAAGPSQTSAIKMATIDIMNGRTSSKCLADWYETGFDRRSYCEWSPSRTWFP